MKISVIVTNFNGEKLLKKNLVQVIKTSPEAQEVIVADDASYDGSIKYLKKIQKKYPQLKIISHKENIGFGKNSNDAVSKASGELVVLLNSDIYPYPDYLKASLKHFDDPNVFGVSFAEKGHENWARIFWKDGYLQHEPGKDISKTHISAWVSGGSSIIRKSMFEQLKGFDEVYAPFYSEDLDLGFRAWKSGFKLLWEPKSVVEHNHESTISKFNKRFLDYVKERNRLLTVWRNITDPELLKKNRFALIGRVLSGPNYIKIIRASLLQIRQSKSPVHLNKLTDKQVLELFK